MDSDTQPKGQNGVCHACGKECAVFFSNGLPYCKECIKIYGGDND